MREMRKKHFIIISLLLCLSIAYVLTSFPVRKRINPIPASRFLLSFIFSLSFHMILPIGNLKVTKTPEAGKKRIVTSVIRFVSCP